MSISWRWNSKYYKYCVNSRNQTKKFLTTVRYLLPFSCNCRLFLHMDRQINNETKSSQRNTKSLYGTISFSCINLIKRKLLSCYHRERSYPHLYGKVYSAVHVSMNNENCIMSIFISLWDERKFGFYSTEDKFPFDDQFTKILWQGEKEIQVVRYTVYFLTQNMNTIFLLCTFKY